MCFLNVTMTINEVGGHLLTRLAAGDGASECEIILLGSPILYVKRKQHVSVALKAFTLIVLEQ